MCCGMASLLALAYLAFCVLLTNAEICEEGRKEPMEGDCSRYRTCTGGRWEVVGCSLEGQVYNPKSATCVNNEEYECKNTTSCHPEGLIRPDEECTRYQVCREGSWSTYQCHNNYAFDTVTSTCIRKENATCYKCDGDYPDPSNCKIYYTCVGTRKVKKYCGWLKHFDGVTGKCVYFGAHCKPGGACVGEGAKHSTNDCKEYQQCLSGKLYKKSCGYSRIFDSVKEKCVWVWPWQTCEWELNTVCTDDETKLEGCRSFSICKSGRWQQQECKQDETVKGGKCVQGMCVFSAQDCAKYIVNGEQVICDNGYYFDEILSKCVPGICHGVATVPNSSCKEGETTRVKGSCKEYTKCENGVLVNHKCTSCQNFDDNKSKCMFVWDSPCDDGPPTTPATTTTSTTTSAPTTTSMTTSAPTTTSTTTSAPTTNSTTTSTPTTTSTSTTAAPLCTPGQRKPDYNSCWKYYECDKEQVFKQKSCWWLFFFRFDVDTLHCKFYWSAHCATKL